MSQIFSFITNVYYDIIDNKTTMDKRVINVIDIFIVKNKYTESIGSDIENSAGVIIGEIAINALTVDALVLYMGISKNQISTFRKWQK